MNQTSHFCPLALPLVSGPATESYPARWVLCLPLSPLPGHLSLLLPRMSSPLPLPQVTYPTIPLILRENYLDIISGVDTGKEEAIRETEHFHASVRLPLKETI